MFHLTKDINKAEDSYVDW